MTLSALGIGMMRPPSTPPHEGLTFNFLSQQFVSRPAGGVPEIFASAGAALSFTTPQKYVRSQSGPLVLIPANQPAYEFNAAGQPLGLLIEHTATNLILHSADLTQTAFIKEGLQAFGSGSSSNAEAAPDGTMTADLIREDSATSFHAAHQLVTVSAATYTYSVFVKRPATNPRRWMVLGGYVVGTAAWPRAWFDLQNGVVGTLTGGASATIEAHANGWFRVSMTYTLPANDTIQFSAHLSSADATITYAGDNASGLVFWGAQVEASGAPTSYIATVASAVARASDTVQRTPASGEISNAQGTSFVEFMIRANRAVIRGALTRGTGVTGGGMSLISDSHALALWDSTNYRTVLVGPVAPNTILRAGANWGGGPANLFGAATANGGAVSTGTGSFDGSLGQDNLILGEWGGERLNGWIRRVEIWPTRQSDTAISAMVA